MSPCPSLFELVRLDEESLSPADAARVRAHWEACESCQVRLQQEIDAMVQRGRERFGDRPIPVGRRDDRGFQRLVAARDKLARRGRRRRLALSALAASGVVLIVLLVHGRMFSAPTADDILARAIAKERDAAEGAVRHVRITITGRGGASEASAVGELLGTNLTPLQGRGVESVAAEVDLREPLSAASFASWRSQLGARRDRVMTSGDLLTLQTSATGRIRVRELLLQRATYRVVGQVWTLDDDSRVAVAETWASSDLTAGAARAEASPAASEAAASALDEQELAAYLAVGEIDPEGRVDIERKDARVTVTGRVKSVAERDALDSRLAGHPDVHVRLTLGSTAAPRPVGRGLEQWASRTLGSEGARRTFASALQTAAAGVQRHSTRLSALARRYPDDVDAGKSDARRLLQQVVTREYRALVRDLLALDARSTFIGVGGRGLLPLPSEGPPADWRSRIAQGQSAADAVKDAVDALVVAEDLSDEQVSAPLTRLWHALQPTGTAGRK